MPGGTFDLLSLAGVPPGDASFIAPHASLLHGRCGTNEGDQPISHTTINCSSVYRSWYSANTTPTLRECSERCVACSDCRYASFSAVGPDCSQYSACNVNRLPRGFGYRTVDLSYKPDPTAAATRGVRRVAGLLELEPTSSKEQPADAPAAPAGGGCTVVNFRHLIKTGGTTVRQWMVDVAVGLGWGLSRNNEQMFCASIDDPPNSSCRSSGLMRRPDAAFLSRLNASGLTASGFLIESHDEQTVLRVWRALVAWRRRRVRAAGTELSLPPPDPHLKVSLTSQRFAGVTALSSNDDPRPVWPTFGCRTVIAILWRDPGIPAWP